MTETNRRIVLKRRPVGMPTPDDFAFEEAPVPEPKEGEVVLKHLYLSLDPYQRGRLSDARSYATPVPIGGVVECRTVGHVLASRDARFDSSACSTSFDAEPSSARSSRSATSSRSVCSRGVRAE